MQLQLTRRQTLKALGSLAGAGLVSSFNYPAQAAKGDPKVEQAIERGVFAQAIRPPTVPDGTSRLRLAVMTHTRDELRAAARTLGRAALQAGFDVGTRAEAAT